MIRSLVIAQAANRVIGRDNRMPWHLPADLAHFKRITMGHPVIMGRKTWESIGRALPGRLNIVITRSAGYAAPGATVVASLEAAYRAAGDADEVFIIGGGQIYAEAMATADRIYLTEIAAEIEGDITFPALDRSQWRETLMGEHAPDEKNAHPLRFLLLERRSAPAQGARRELPG